VPKCESCGDIYYRSDGGDVCVHCEWKERERTQKDRDSAELRLLESVIGDLEKMRDKSKDSGNAAWANGCVMASVNHEIAARSYQDAIDLIRSRIPTG